MDDNLENQSSLRDINFVNGVQYIINNSRIEIVNDNDSSKEIELRVKEFEKVDYLRLLNKDCNNKKIVHRKDIIDKINELIIQEHQVLLYGDPGIGKTILLNELSKDKDSIYISLKGKSLKRVVKYLIDSIGISYSFKEDDDWVSLLESILQTCSKHFFIDDCESDIKTFQVILSMEKFNNIFIYASRNKNITDSFRLKSYEIKPFNEKEIINFLSNNMDNTDITEVIEFQELISNSKGNPLYLYYYSKHQISPLPQDLLEYQMAIWNTLKDEEKEIISCITTAYFPISINILKIAFETITFNKISPMQFIGMFSKIEFLLKIDKENYEVFHPTFKEFVTTELSSKGILDYYKRNVGKASLNNNDYIEATLLLINIDNELIKPYFFETAHILYLGGFLDLSIKVLESFSNIFDLNTESLELGYASYHLSNIYKDLHDIEKAYSSIDEAIKYFTTAGNEEFYALSLTFKMLFLAEDGKKKDSLELLEGLLQNLPKSQLHQAIIFLNISKAYLCFNQYKLGAENAKKAIEIFKSLNDLRGLRAGILNYSACLGQINEEELALEYLEKIIKLEKVKNEPQLKAAILNNLTACYRKKRMYKEAKKSCIQSIRICYKLKLEAKVVMNLLNLGNVYRDEKNYEKSERVYLKGLEIAEKISYQKEIGRALELLANIYNKQGRSDIAKQRATEAIDASNAARDNFRVAEAYIERADANKELGLIDDYAQDLDDAITNYLKEGFIEEAIYYLFKSCKVHYEFNHSGLIKRNIGIIKNIILENNIDDYNVLHDHIEDVDKEIDKVELLKLNELIFDKYIENKSKICLVLPFVNFISLCKECIQCEGKQVFIRVINKILNNLQANTKLLNLLAFGIEQSGILLNFDGLEEIIEKLSRMIKGFYYREISDGSAVITISLDNGVVLQINSPKTELMQHKIAISIAIIIKSNEYIFHDKISKSSKNGLELHVFDFDTFNEKIFRIEESFEEMVSAVFAGLEDKDDLYVMILHKRYSDISDFNINRDNKAFIWILMNLYRIITNHFSDADIEDDNALVAKEARLFAEVVTGLKSDIFKDEKWVIKDIGILGQ